MIIRSQDKKSIVNFDNIRTITLDVQKPNDRTMILEKYETIIVGYGAAGAVDLGIYDSEEKAIKVLDMIQDAYARCVSVRTLTSGIVHELVMRLDQEQGENFRKDHRANFVFQMPRNSEV